MTQSMNRPNESIKMIMNQANISSIGERELSTLAAGHHRELVA